MSLARQVLQGLKVCLAPRGLLVTLEAHPDPRATQGHLARRGQQVP